MPPVNTERLRDRRDELDLSNADLAGRMEMSESYLRNILCGADEPSKRLIYRFSRVLDLPVEDIEAIKPQGDPSEPPDQPKVPKPPPKRKESAGGGPKRGVSRGAA